MKFKDLEPGAFYVDGVPHIKLSRDVYERETENACGFTLPINAVSLRTYAPVFIWEETECGCALDLFWRQNVPPMR